MPWTKQSGPDGLPLWRGQDAIFNPRHVQSQQTFKLCLVLGAMALACVVFGLQASKAPAGILFITALALGSIAVVVGIEAWSNIHQFQGEHWKLVISGKEISFRSPESWAVPLDALARVEVARTAEYTPSRDYRGRGLKRDFLPITEHEWQTFLFLNDGTRRVIYHANAARDDCAALAASIREYVESARAGAAAPAPAASGVADAPRAAGFDL